MVLVIRALIHAILALGFFVAPCTAGGLIRREARPAESGLRKTLQSILGAVAAQRLFDVEEVLRPAYEAFPKNRQGKVPMQAIHSIVRSFFMEEHGWLIKGFEFDTVNSTHLQGARVLHDRAPDLEKALLEAEKSDVGVSLSDVVAVAAAVEHLILDESQVLLKVAYDLNNVSASDLLADKDIHEVLTSFLVLYRQGESRNLTDKAAHQVYKSHARQSARDWDRLVTFERQAAAPSTSVHRGRRHSFQAASGIVQDIALQYGRWQNSECDEIKTRLVQLAINGTGRVPFTTFHAEPAHEHFSLSEGLEYLRLTGTLDESTGEPQVIVSNYLASSSNCIASSTYYSICCLSECESLMNDLEDRVDQVAEVPVQKLLNEVAQMTSSTVTAPRQLPENLVQRARSMERHHQGFVPLHSADFKQWFHYAFPNECTFPTASEAAAEESEGRALDNWLGRSRKPEWQVSAEGALLTV